MSIGFQVFIAGKRREDDDEGKWRMERIINMRKVEGCKRCRLIDARSWRHLSGWK